MRILHTADWHIGQTLNGWTRDTEHEAFLRRLPDLVDAHRADALVVAGDVFDGVNPSAESMRMLYEALAALRARHPRLITVMVAGNHDPAGRLEAPAALFRAIGVHVVGVVHRRAGALDLDRHLVPLPGPTGAIEAYCLAVPFLRAADLPGLGQAVDGDGSPVVAATRRVYAEAVASALDRVGRLPLIATGHLHCTGALESVGAERRILIGGEHAVPHDIFPDALAYVALGHLHKPQQVGRAHVRYAGAPFPLSATELGYDHGVTLVDVAAVSARTEHIPVSRSVPCLRLPEAGSVTPAQLADAVAALALDPECPRDTQPLVHVVIRPDGPAAGLAGEVQRLLEAHPLRCAGVKIERPAAAAGEAVPAPAISLAECDPADLFAQAFEAAHATPPGPEHRSAFEDIRTEAA
ncbi:nuclease SbcCD subunit D [Alsobacter metallidurans]|uniref:Nuclease SbcCD subunit D n=1 Tax=Alsobacter metallidurans TaxID=340221 RepID=A0A917MKF3_9HYPH|nr:exonuclease subunit SbcD [Alsobacter metallidurans]GGH23324.1 nuclease SbcCD subunit D [Alsobacter metallidurans]